MASFNQKKITQNTFDEVVKENMEEFEMSLEEAVKEAIYQFQSQGVDLSSVDTSGNPDSASSHQELIGWIDQIKDGTGSIADMIQILEGLKERFRAEGDAGDLAKSIACQYQGNRVLCTLLRKREDNSLVVPTLQALTSLCKDNAEAKQAFYGEDIGSLVAVIQRTCPTAPEGEVASVATESSDEPEQQKTQYASLLAALVAVRLLTVKCENNKVWFMKEGGAPLLLDVIKLVGENQSRRKLLMRAAFQALQSLIIADDTSKDFSAAFDHARDFVAKGAIPAVMEGAKQFEGDYEVVSAALLAVRGLACNNDSVKEISKHGGNELIAQVLSHSGSDCQAKQAAVALVRNICADDTQKVYACESNLLTMIIDAMKQHPGSAQLQEHAIASFAQMALRSPANAQQIVEAGVPRCVTTAMRRHPTIVPLQRQGCLCIRNIVARSPQYIEVFLEEGAEPLLREAGKYQGSVDEAYGALRDLHCEVSLVQVGNDGSVIGGAVEMFGVRNSAFNPVYDEHEQTESKVKDSSHAPSNDLNF